MNRDGDEVGGDFKPSKQRAGKTYLKLAKLKGHAGGASESANSLGHSSLRTSELAAALSTGPKVTQRVDTGRAESGAPPPLRSFGTSELGRARASRLGPRGRAPSRA
eukprot:763735-Hanusia_phi.AAC.4